MSASEVLEVWDIVYSRVSSGATVTPTDITNMYIVSTQDLDRSTGSSFDDRDVFGREKTLRMDEEIMDFQLFEHVTWDSIKDLRRTRPTRFKFCVGKNQTRIRTMHNIFPAPESVKKAFVLCMHHCHAFFQNG